MKKCLVCGRRVVSKRKDAIYCRDPRCRKAAFLERKKQAASTPLPIGSNKASVVVAFPDGSRWLLELTPLQATDQASLPTLTQVSRQEASPHPDVATGPASPIEAAFATATNGSEQIRSATVDAVEGAVIGEEGPSPAAVDGAAKEGENSSEQIQACVGDAASSPGPASRPTPEVAETRPSSIPAAEHVEPEAVAALRVERSEARVTGLRTVELYFVNRRGRRIAFEAATQCQDLAWRLMPGAMAQLGFGPSEGMGLGGVPGRWRDFYPQESPRQRGFYDDLAVLCWEDGERRAYAAERALLRVTFGAQWAETIRAFAAGRLDAKKDAGTA